MLSESSKWSPTLSSMITGILPNSIRNDPLALSECQLKVDHFVQDIVQAQQYAAFRSDTRLIDLLCRCIGEYSHSRTISRNDKANGFWEGPESEKYLRTLEKGGKKSIRQTRILVSDRERKFGDDLGARILSRLQACHAPGSLFQVEADAIDNFSLKWLKACTFGLTLFWNEGNEIDSAICIVAVPSHPVNFSMLDLELLPSTFVDLKPWHFPLRGFVIKDQRTVAEIWKETDSLLERVKSK